MVKANIEDIRKAIPSNIALVCVSKFHTKENILEAYDAGERLFGESRVQELVEKQPSLPHDIQWHFIGHLQTNKIRQIAPFVALIQSVDSEKLLLKINEEAVKIRRTIDCLLQVHVAQETTKFGFASNEFNDFLANKKWTEMKNVRIRGIMGMATFTDDKTLIHKEFNLLKTIFDHAKSDYFSRCDFFDTLSMGMSEDYEIAIAEGSTMLRIGSDIFGTRTKLHA